MAQKNRSSFSDYGLTALVLVCAAVFYLSLTRSGGGTVDMPAPELKKAVEQLGGAAAQVPVVVLVTEWCPACRSLEAELQRLGVVYTRGDVEKNRTASELYAKVSRGNGDGVPKTLVGNRLFIGYQPQAIVNAIQEYSRKGGEDRRQAGEGAI